MVEEIIKLFDEEKQKALEGFFESRNCENADPFKYRYYAGRAWAIADLKNKVLEILNK